ncbi:E1 [Canine papillomavirus 21]|uniref:E1 n=1 Tax=Canine papillomavirus 21 TaxID=2304619 RepID=UPI000E35D70F|nr:E1 [Canine papillomavirus 21]AXQ03944.1 E1 [Canine papillomavirus 21]
MADGERGNENLVDGGWYLVTEAECGDDDDGDLEDLESMFDKSTDSNVSNLINDDDDDDDEDTEVDRALLGGHAALFNQQELEEDRSRLCELKRKYTTPTRSDLSVCDLSPQLQAVTLSPHKKSSKRRLFEDSGIDTSQNETSLLVTSPEQVQETPQNGRPDECRAVFTASRNEAATLASFKSAFGVEFRELTRIYKSSKTCCTDWVVYVWGVRTELLDAAKTLLEPHASFFQLTRSLMGDEMMLLVCFKSAKSRDTLLNLFSTMLHVGKGQIKAEPPRNRSVPVALFFFKSAMSKATHKHGEYPDWLACQLLIQHQSGSESFELQKMVQWAYDNRFTDESEIAFEYARIADVDANAAAWLRHNAQARFVKDCASMVKHYRRHEMRSMSMSQWVSHCCSKVTEDGDWTQIAKFLKYQCVNFLDFLGALRHLLAGVPKKQCIIFHGPPDTGKSHFCFTLIQFLQGKVVSFVNSKSHFWLMPLADTKIGMLDDATHACLQYLDQTMRSAFDGNTVALDCKHKSLMQMKMPPMLLTSNINIHDDPLYFYLKSRMKGFCFGKPFPFNEDGSPLFSLTSSSWKSFFQRLHHQLGLDLDEEDGDPSPAFRASAGSSVSAL